MLAYEADHRLPQHHQARAAERALRSDAEEFLMTGGPETRAAGATHTTLVRRDLPIDLQGTEEAARAEGWIIVVDSPVTCYRRTDTWRFIRRKSQMRPRRRSRKA